MMNHQKAAVLAVLQDGCKHSTKEIAKLANSTTDTVTVVLRRLRHAGIAIQICPAIKRGRKSTPAVWRLKARPKTAARMKLRPVKQQPRSEADRRYRDFRDAMRAEKAKT
jgi:transposase